MKKVITAIVLTVASSNVFAWGYNQGDSYTVTPGAFGNGYDVKDSYGNTTQTVTRGAFGKGYDVKDSYGNTMQTIRRDPFTGGYTVRKY